MSRTILRTEATTRPYSSQKASSTRARTSPAGVCPWCIDPTGQWYSIRRQSLLRSAHAALCRSVSGSLVRRRTGPRRSHWPDRTHVDEAALAQRDLLGPFDGFFPRVALDQIETAQAFLRLGERPVHHLALPGLHA